MVAHFVRDEGVAGSNPVIPTTFSPPRNQSPEGFSERSGDFLLGEKSQDSTPVKSKSWTQVGHVQPGFLSVSDAAEKLNISVKTVMRWCESGRLPAIPKPYGKRKTYLISPQAVEVVLLSMQQAQEEAEKPCSPYRTHTEAVPAWKQAMAKGLLTGKPFSPRTMETYCIYVEPFMQKHTTLTQKIFQSELMRIPANNFAKKLKFYEALTCFAKFLIMENALESDFLEPIKALRPKRHIPPKRFTITEEELGSLLNACDNSFERLMVNLLASTGIRASELCAIKLSDVDLKAGQLVIPLGKGSKRRIIGLTQETVRLMTVYLLDRGSPPRQTNLFLTVEGVPLKRRGLHSRIERIGKQAKVQVSPHALRRYFATHNLLKGRPLPLVQKAMGHSSITTTRLYCLDSEMQLIQAMQQWD